MGGSYADGSGSKIYINVLSTIILISSGFAAPARSKGLSDEFLYLCVRGLLQLRYQQTSFQDG